MGFLGQPAPPYQGLHVGARVAPLEHTARRVHLAQAAPQEVSVRHVRLRDVCALPLIAAALAARGACLPPGAYTRPLLSSTCAVYAQNTP
jgi:hypothetical protein